VSVAAIHRYEITVDDQWHELPLCGPIYHVAAREPRYVELWALDNDGAPTWREFRVFATGQPLPPEDLHHVGTAITADGHLVWHLMERI
jgi:hypothetical protein